MTKLQKQTWTAGVENGGRAMIYLLRMCGGREAQLYACPHSLTFESSYMHLCWQTANAFPLTTCFTILGRFYVVSWASSRILACLSLKCIQKELCAWCAMKYVRRVRAFQWMWWAFAVHLPRRLLFRVSLECRTSLDCDFRPSNSCRKSWVACVTPREPFIIKLLEWRHWFCILRQAVWIHLQHGSNIS